MADAIILDQRLRKRMRGWMMFDWATQPFYTLGLTFIFGPYFAGVAAEYFFNGGLDQESANASAQTIWSWGQAAAGLFVAVIGILAGSHADSTGRRMPWLWAASIVFVICSWMLWYMVPDGSAMWSSLIIFCIAFVAAELALVFTNAVLPSLGNRREVGEISGSGASLGYAGGILSLFIMLFFFFDEGGKTFMIGLDPGFGFLDSEAREGTRAVGPLIAIWFAIFMVPYFMWVREDETPNSHGRVLPIYGHAKTFPTRNGKAAKPICLHGRANVLSRRPQRTLCLWRGLCSFDPGLGANAAWYFWYN